MNIEISKKKLLNNLQVIANNEIKTNQIIAVLKDNAYGHGIKKIAYWLLENELEFFAVANIEEAIIIKEICKKAKVIILKRLNNLNNLIIAVKNDIVITIDNYEYLQNVYQYAIKNKLIIKCNIKINLDLHRWGMNYNIELIKKLHNYQNNLFFEGVYSQLSDLHGIDFNRNDEFDKIKMFYDNMMNNGIGVKYYHSKSTWNIGQKLYKNEYIRIGAGIYGIPNILTGNLLHLEPIMGIYCEIQEVRYIKKGTIIGYAHNNILINKNMYIYIIDIGYSNGLKTNYKLYTKNNIELYILYLYLDSAVLSCDEEKLNIGDILSLDVKSSHTPSQLCCDFGNMVTNKLKYY